MNTTGSRTLRLWPGLIFGGVVAAGYLLPFVLPDYAVYGLLARLSGTAAIVLWWLFFSRAPWVERVGALAVMGVAVAAIMPLLHESIRGGFMNRMPFIYAPPLMALALVAWAAVADRLSTGPRRAAMAMSILLGGALLALVRTDGILGGGVSLLAWRWTPTAEDKLLTDEPVVALPPATPPSVSPAPPPVPPPADAKTSSATPPAGDNGASDPKAAQTGATASVRDTARTGPATIERAGRRVEWPGFRGGHRDSVVRGIRVTTDWAASPPVELWHRPIGPGWSSFAVDGDLIYTQEQRGEDELVSCYRLSTGAPVWRHRDAARFYESNGGPGPRGTPTLSHGRVYAVGATGIVNVLDAATGDVVWSRNAVSDTGVEIPGWGITSSPLVVKDVVIVAVSGVLIGYDERTGNPRWTGPRGGAGYSSPHLVTIDGVPQVMLLRGSRTVSVDPANGTLLWEHKGDTGASIIQPGLVDRDVLIPSADAMGGIAIRRVAVTRDGTAWKVEERWASRGLKPYFNDFVVHEGHAYGFDGNILSSINLADGERTWKGGRYGHGQMLLLSEQDLLLVVSEEGDLALVSATPDKFTELARIPALDGKTWNHPVIVGDVLLLRNGETMAAFRLPQSTTR